jgi:hypothetical protein
MALLTFYAGMTASYALLFMLARFLLKYVTPHNQFWAHPATWLAVSGLYMFGSANGGPLDPITALVTCRTPAAVLLAWDRVDAHLKTIRNPE